MTDVTDVTDVTDLRDDMARIIMNGPPAMTFVAARELVDRLIQSLDDEGYAIGIDPDGETTLN